MDWIGLDWVGKIVQLWLSVITI